MASSIITEKDVCGFTMLHHASANNCLELAYVLANQKDVNINERDNYGRTPLFWAFWSGNAKISVLLYSKGAKLDLQDEVGDTCLHISVRQEQWECIQKTLFALLKFDDAERQVARMVLKTMTLKNANNISAYELAQQSDPETASLFRALSNICNKRIAETNTIYVSNIALRSGIHNGKTLGQLLEDSTSFSRIHLDTAGKTLQLVAGNNIRITIQQTNVAFLIVNASQLRIEMTLLSPPAVETLESKSSFDIKGVLQTCLAYHLEITSKVELDKVTAFIKSCSVLQEFQTNCFCYRPVNTSTSPTPASKETTASKAKSGKMHLLRERFDQMRLRTINVAVQDLKQPSAALPSPTQQQLQQL